MNTSVRRALVVDDEAMIACAIEDILKDQGYEVIVVTSREKLEEAMLYGPYKIAVTDTDLATPDDVRTWAAERIILCSGKPREDLERDFAGLEFLAKPFGEEDLLRTLGRGSLAWE